MKALLTVAALAVSIGLAAQCDLKTTTIDSVQVTSGSVKWLGCDGMSSCSSVEFQKYGTQDPFYMVQVTHAITGAQVIVCGTNDALVLKFAEGDSITLYTDKVYSGTVNTDPGTGNSTTYVGMYRITKEQMELLSTKKLVSMRLNHQKGVITMEVKKKKQEQASDAVKCLLK